MTDEAPQTDVKTVSWAEEDLLSVAQIAALANVREKTLRDAIRAGQLPAPEESGGYRPDVIQVWLKDRPKPVTRRQVEPVVVEWADNQMLRIKQIAALHNPPISDKTVGSYLQRTRTRLAEGHDVSRILPLPDRTVFGRPLWKPETIRDYLAQRPGPTGWNTDAQRYRGGRKKGVRPKSVLAREAAEQAV